MKIQLLVIGKENSDLFDEAVKSYSKKINFYLPFEIVAIPYLKNAKSLSVDEQKKREGELLLKKIEHDDILILLDERGKELASREMAAFIQQQANEGVKKVIFLIGGAYGVSEKISSRANFTFSLSRMTFPHIMTRVIFAEQLYRAFTIIRGEPYHHD